MVSRALSIEDGNLNTASVVTSRRVDYKDVDLTFTAKPSGDIFKKIDAAAVKQAVKNVLLTRKGEKPFDPYFGAGLYDIIFELVDNDSEEELDEAIRFAVEDYEPRARITRTEISVQPDLNSVSVEVEFQIVNTNETVIFETFLTRVR